MQILKLSELKKTNVTALIYAPPGIGKTSLLAELPGKTLIIDVDEGTSVLVGKEADIEIVRLDEDLQNMIEVITKLEESCPFDNVCIDSLSELEKKMLTVYGRLGKNDGAPEMLHYNRVQFKITDICRRVRALPANKIFTAWETLVEYVHPSGEKYTQAKPMLSGKTTETICGLCDVVGHLEISTQKDAEGMRFIRLESTPTVIAKDRINKRRFCRTNELITRKD